MGVVNITPDSFYDGGRYLDPDKAVEHALALADQGADILDLGGESSRPGAKPVCAAEEIDRVLPVLEALRPRFSGMISVDTYKAPVAEAVLEGGADIINDISAFRFDPQLPQVVARWQAGVVLMHSRGTPETMQTLPPSPDILAEIQSTLQEALETARQSQIGRDRILLDPGIGFGKTAEQNLQIVNRLSALEAFHLPLLVGTSRKSFIGRILNQPPEERLLGSLASSGAAVLRGACVLRVHDVRETRQVTDVIDAILAERFLG